jgi:hypothetical protein
MCVRRHRALPPNARRSLQPQARPGPHTFRSPDTAPTHVLQPGRRAAHGRDPLPSPIRATVAGAEGGNQSKRGAPRGPLKPRASSPPPEPAGQAPANPTPRRVRHRGSLYRTPPAARTITALLTLRDQVNGPILAGVRSPGSEPNPPTGPESTGNAKPGASTGRPVPVGTVAGGPIRWGDWYRHGLPRSTAGSRTQRLWRAGRNGLSQLQAA